MIKNIFIPEAIGSYYLFSQDIVGIEINQDYILATKITASGKKRIIKNIYSENINSYKSLEEAIFNLKNKLGKFSKIIVSLPTSFAVFKELELPFIGANKAKMVAPFEIESSLPFSINQAEIDSIIINQDKTNKKTYLVTAAIKKDIIEKYINAFEKSNLKIDKLSLDIFELYGLYNNLNIKANNIALINLNLKSTTIAVIINNNLHYIRSLPKGITTGQSKEILNKLLDSKLEDFDKITSNEIYQEKYKDLASQISFTVETILRNLEIKNKETTAVITGFGSQIIGMPEFICETLKSECKTLGIKEIVKSGIQSKIKNIPNEYILSIATALPNKTTTNFNLINKARQDNNTLVNQILTFLFLSSLTLIIFLAYSFISVRNIRNKTINLETQAINKLKNAFDIKKANSLKAANNSAESKLKQEEETISQILDKNSYSFLNYLDELNRVIDKERIDLKIDKMDIINDKITIYGTVKNIEAAKIFENELEESPIFSIKTTLQTPDFTKNPMVIKIIK